MLIKRYYGTSELRCSPNVSMCWQVIAAEGEQKASKALKAAADIIDESKSALQLRYLQTLNQISAEKNSTIIFPMPIDFVTNNVKGTSKWRTTKNRRIYSVNVACGLVEAFYEVCVHRGQCFIQTVV